MDANSTEYSITSKSSKTKKIGGNDTSTIKSSNSSKIIRF